MRVAHSVLSGRSSRRFRRCALLAEPLIVRLLHRRERPAVSGELARDRDDDDCAGLASGLERVPACVQPPGAALGLGLDRERLAGASAFERDAPARRAALVPGRLDQKPAYMAVACLGDRALATSLAAGVFTWGEPEERPQRRLPSVSTAPRRTSTRSTPTCSTRRRGTSAPPRARSSPTAASRSARSSS